MVVVVVVTGILVNNTVFLFTQQLIVVTKCVYITVFIIMLETLTLMKVCE